MRVIKFASYEPQDGRFTTVRFGKEWGMVARPGTKLTGEDSKTGAGLGQFKVIGSCMVASAHDIPEDWIGLSNEEGSRTLVGLIARLAALYPNHSAEVVHSVILLEEIHG